MANIMDEADKEFYLPYGRAMEAWASVEGCFGVIFQAITALPLEVSDAVFFSARSFQGRADMVRAVIPFSKTIPAGRTFLAELSNRASAYVGTRNRLAHEPHFVEAEIDPPYGRRRIMGTDGKPIIDAQYLERVHRNFLDLAMIGYSSLGKKKLVQDGELSLAALRAMPADAADARTDPSEANRLLRQILAAPD